jgi:N-acetyl-gamma-glutamyl-phosphate reductase
MTRRIAVLGTSGFTGKECLRLLGAHPEFAVETCLSLREEPRAGLAYSGALHENASEALDLDRLQGIEAVLACGPHEPSADLVPKLLEIVPKVIDLSAAFRLAEPGLYPRFYGFEHPRVDLLETRVFGLTEWVRDSLPSARLVANPGCYVTSVLLPLKALLEARCIAEGTAIIADCKSGVSGAGKSLGPSTHFASVHEDFRAYAVGAHRHEPEIREQLGTDQLYFTPHLLPVFRGILSTIHLEPASGLGAQDLRAALEDRYRDEPFVQVLPTGLPCLSEVQGTNLCRIGLAQHGDRVVVVSSLDNLIKGAAGQAIQNLNAMFGLPETLGLTCASLAPQGWR